MAFHDPKRSRSFTEPNPNVSKKIQLCVEEEEPIHRHEVPLLWRRLYQQEEATTAPPRLLDAAAVVVVLSGIH
jgi:hypothetical protein